MAGQIMSVARQALSQLRASLGLRSGSRQEQPAFGDANNRTTPASQNATSMFHVVDALPDATLLLDASLSLLHGNALARDVFGVLRAGQHISRTSRDPDLMAALVQAQKSGLRVQFELVQRGPVERRLEGAATALSNTNTKTERAAPTFLVTLQDLSERDALARMRVEFVANASHELRTPLASLAGFIETLSGPAKNDPVARERFLGIMADQAARMTRLIDDLLALSRVEMRAHVTPTAMVDVNLLIEDAAEPLEQLAAKTGTTLTCQPSSGQLLVRGDHDELIQAVHNLIQNAIKYGKPGGGTVRVQAVQAAARQGQGPRALIQVIDDGPGIPAEHLPRLTERFYRVNTASSRDKGGTGLGLAIVKHIASRHQGKLEIVSAIGQGSSFTISIPAATGASGKLV
jgi:two-component system, OmpR family, phosphate regulon sensor histidine kinase PhoR